MRNVRHLLATLSLLIVSAPAFAQQSLPSDPQTTTCSVSSQTFNTWFQSGSVSANGAVKPANSITFPSNNNCDFYLWSQQMLLWLLSPAPSQYGGSGLVFDSNVFFDVTQPINKKRYFVPHIPFPPNATEADKARRMVNLRPAKPGPNGLPAVIDSQGKIIEVLPADLGPNRRPLVLNQAGRSVEAARVSVSADKRAVFHDADGNVIALPKLTIPASLRGARIGFRFFTGDNTPIIVSPDGAVFDVSPAQAGGSGVLLAQNSTVVYYTTVTNDVFTYLASMNSGKPATLFPTTQAELDRIQAYATQTYGAGTFPDGIALAVEVKLSWVDISAVSNPGSYVTSPAFVPTYNTSNPKQWVPTGEKFTTLALVGVHFVGSAAHHPEMIWSTFEHFGNSPTGQYQYVNKNNQTVTVPANSAGKWLFSASNSNGPFNVVHADYKNPPNIEGATVNGQQFNVSPSDTQLVYQFGVGPTGQPNNEDTTPAAANTEVLSINNSVLNKLASGDVRANYYFVGSTWTFGGYSPTGQYNNLSNPTNPTKPANTGNGSEIGTNRLANSTMETYHQASSSINPPAGSGSNCFSCHADSTTGHKATTDVSHIFSDMLPLGTFSAASPTDAPPPNVIPTLTNPAKTSATNKPAATSQTRTTKKKG